MKKEHPDIEPGTLMWWCFSEPPDWSEIYLGADTTIIVYDHWKPAAAGARVPCPSVHGWMPELSLCPEEWV